jgi:hypothetical protein
VVVSLSPLSLSVPSHLTREFWLIALMISPQLRYWIFGSTPQAIDSMTRLRPAWFRK